MVTMVVAGPAAARESASPADRCPGSAASEQYGAVCGAPAEAAEAARDAADDSRRAAGEKGGAEAFGEAVEAAGVGNAPPAATPSSVKEEFGIDVLPKTGGIPVLRLAGGVLLTMGGLLGFGTASRRCPHRPSKRRGMG